MSPKMGQKITDKPKNKLIQVRMDKETVEKLDYLAAEQNSDRSKIIRQGIEIQYNQRNKEKKAVTATDYQSITVATARHKECI